MELMVPAICSIFPQTAKKQAIGNPSIETAGSNWA